MAELEDDDYFVPLTDQRVFGAGLKRKRVVFVPASDEHDAATKLTKSTNTGDRYLSIVLKKSSSIEDSERSNDVVKSHGGLPTASVCSICGQTLSDVDVNAAHESSIAHQVCLQHSHPPSHIDRSRAGVKYLQDYGWDPDSRQGLGARQEGMRIPIKVKQKNDTVGLDVIRDEAGDEENLRRKTKARPANKQIVKLNAKEVRKLEEQKSQRAEKLRQSVYGKDLQPYLG